jgi:hypothetical protein
LLFPHNSPHTLKFEFVNTAWTKQPCFQITPHASLNFQLVLTPPYPHCPNPVWSSTQHLHAISRNQSPTKSAPNNNLPVSDARWNLTKTTQTI